MSTKPRFRRGRKAVVTKPESRQEIKSAIDSQWIPKLVRGTYEPRPLAIFGQHHTTRIRYRALAGFTTDLTGDCFCNLLAYQTTSAVANRIMTVCKISRIEMWAASGAAGSTADIGEPGQVELAISGNYNDLPHFARTAFADAGSRQRSGHLAVDMPAHMIYDCAASQREKIMTLAGPAETIIDVTIEWSWYYRAAYSPYTLSTNTTDVGRGPYLAYLDNTSSSGGAGSNNLPRIGSVDVGDVTAYG